MPIERIAVVTRRRGPRAAHLLFAVLATLLTSGCTRDEVGAAIATFAVEIQATLEPMGATVEANIRATQTSTPTTEPPAESATVAAPTTAPATAPATATPTAPATLLPTPTLAPTATPTPLPSPTALPVEVIVPHGSMLLVSGGFFQMGAAADDLLTECQRFTVSCRRDWFLAAEPVHSVLLAPYYLDSHEVTNTAFVEFLNAVGGESAECQGQTCIDPAASRIAWENGIAVVSADRAQHPVTGVTWYGADAFCKWRDSRLPTEAEWEKAAAWDDAAMTARLYPWGDEFHGKYLNFCDATCDAPQANLSYNDGFSVAAPVGNYPDGRGASGHDDLAGNVWEWVADWFDPGYYATSPGADPTGPEAGEQKVVRGGSWNDAAYFTLAAVRLPSPPDNTDATLGFRCAADVP